MTIHDLRVGSILRDLNGYEHTVLGGVPHDK